MTERREMDHLIRLEKLFISGNKNSFHFFVSDYHNMMVVHTFTAVGAEDSVTNVPAASYLTAFDDEFSKL